MPRQAGMATEYRNKFDFTPAWIQMLQRMWRETKRDCHHDHLWLMTNLHPYEIDMESIAPSKFSSPFCQLGVDTSLIVFLA